jgi:acetoin utilization deacetylase AcuC-like enzyme
MLLVATVEDHHDTGPRHPENGERLVAVRAGIQGAGIADALTILDVPAAPRAALERIHPSDYIDEIERACALGKGNLDPDTTVSPGSWGTALQAAGAGLAATAALEAGAGDAAFLAIRPPGHHAPAAHAMGFCLFNNIAITAADLVARGERVLIVDWDAHHGNGTQDIFWDNDQVLFVSLHQWPLYPGTGRLDERGGPNAPGLNLNFPVPAGATGDVYLQALDDVVAPAVERFAPTWVLVSAGFDAHRADPITDLGLAAGDFALLARRVAQFAPRSGRLVLFLEGGYDLDALAASAGSALAALVDHPYRPEPPTSGGPGADVVSAAARLSEGG